MLTAHSSQYQETCYHGGMVSHEAYKLSPHRVLGGEANTHLLRAKMLTGTISTYLLRHRVHGSQRGQEAAHLPISKGLLSTSQYYNTTASNPVISPHHVMTWTMAPMHKGLTWQLPGMVLVK